MFLFIPSVKEITKNNNYSDLIMPYNYDTFRATDPVHHILF